MQAAARYHSACKSDAAVAQRLTAVVGLQPWSRFGVDLRYEDNAQLSVDGHHARCSCRRIVLGTRTDDRVAALHPSEQLERRRPREASLAVSSHSARVG